jgi:MFS superfamily sulfate permease-like transporter
VRSFSIRDFSKKLVSLRPFLLEMVLYGAFVSVYFFLVLRLLGGWIKHVYLDNRILYAVVALMLIGAQGSLLEMLSTGLLRVIQRTQAAIPPLRRLARPHETITRPAEAPGLLVYRFAGPLLFFNAAFFAHRVLELIDTECPPVTFFLVNAEAVVDTDAAGAEVLEELFDSLEGKRITLGMCEVKGHFQEVLMNTSLFGRAGFVVYPSVEAAVREFSELHPMKGNNAEPPGERVQIP